MQIFGKRTSNKKGCLICFLCAILASVCFAINSNVFCRTKTHTLIYNVPFLAAKTINLTTKFHGSSIKLPSPWDEADFGRNLTYFPSTTTSSTHQLGDERASYADEKRPRRIASQSTTHLLPKCWWHFPRWLRLLGSTAVTYDIYLWHARALRRNRGRKPEKQNRLLFCLLLFFHSLQSFRISPSLSVRSRL